MPAGERGAHADSLAVQAVTRIELLEEIGRCRVWQMGKANATLLDRELRATVRSGMFRSRAEALEEALGTFFAAKPQYRLEAALEIYRSGEVSLGRAAEIAGINPVRFRELCVQRWGREEIDVNATDVRVQARRIARRRS